MHELREGATTDESRFRDSRIASFLSINALLDMVKKKRPCVRLCFNQSYLIPLPYFNRYRYNMGGLWFLK